MPISVLDSRPVQMNVRMDRQLKDAGDAVLAQIGITPSQAVQTRSSTPLCSSIITTTLRTT